MDKTRTEQLVQKLSSDEQRRLAQCIEHAFTKPHYELTELVPILVDGHHQVRHESAVRIKAAIKRMTNENLTWIAENVDVLLPE